MAYATSSAGTDDRLVSGRAVAGPIISIDTPFETARLRCDPAWDTEGHSAKTIVKYPDLRVVLTAMKSGKRMFTHETGERMTLQMIKGRVRLWLPNALNTEISEGGFVALDRAVAHEIECMDDCSFLLTVCRPVHGG